MYRVLENDSIAQFGYKKNCAGPLPTVFELNITLFILADGQARQDLYLYIQVV